MRARGQSARVASMAMLLADELVSNAVHNAPVDASGVHFRKDAPRDVEIELEKVIPAAYKLHAHHWLILHGRYICVARKPMCDRCLINELCKWPEKTPPQFSLAERIGASARTMKNEPKFG